MSGHSRTWSQRRSTDDGRAATRPMSRSPGCSGAGRWATASNLCRHPGTTAAVPGRRQAASALLAQRRRAGLARAAGQSHLPPLTRGRAARRANTHRKLPGSPGAVRPHHAPARPRIRTATGSAARQAQPRPHLDRAVAAGVESPRVSRLIKPEEDIVPARHRRRSWCLAARSYDVRSADQEGRSVVMGTVVLRGMPNQ